MSIEKELLLIPATMTSTERLELRLAFTEVQDMSEAEIVECAGCSLDTHPTKHNWVEDAGGLPQYICEIARAILRSGHHSIGQAISIAVSRCRAWASGAGNVDADTRAKAAKAIAEWEAKKAKSHAKK